jgi:hypothetical protein
LREVYVCVCARARVCVCVCLRVACGVCGNGQVRLRGVGQGRWVEGGSSLPEFRGRDWQRAGAKEANGHVPHVPLQSM